MKKAKLFLLTQQSATAVDIPVIYDDTLHCFLRTDRKDNYNRWKLWRPFHNNDDAMELMTLALSKGIFPVDALTQVPSETSSKEAMQFVRTTILLACVGELLSPNETEGETN